MTKAETARILTLIAAFDRRTIGETDVEAWHLILGDLNPDDCADAVREHYTHRNDWLMPADIRNFATTAQRRREGQARIARLEQQIAAENPPAELHHHPTVALTAGQPMPDARTELRQERLRIADRQRREAQAAAAVKAEHAAAMAAARAELEAARTAGTQVATPGGATSGGTTEASA